MLEKFIKKDKNEELERILEEKQIEEQAKNLLQGILYKIEGSYPDYKKATVTEETEPQYVEEILKNIEKKCKQIKIVKLSEKVEDEEIQKELEKNKFYIINNEIISYPIEEKLLYAIEKNANINKIVNDRYDLISIPLSNLINTGKDIDKIEVLRDFNGWSWTTVKSEIENTTANLVYQTLKILLSEEFMQNWTKDTDGIIDYVQQMKEELENKYGKDNANDMLKKLTQISIINEAQQNKKFKEDIEQKLKEVNEILKEYNDTKQKVEKITQHKKQLSRNIKEIEKILNQETKVRQEYKRRNADLPLEKKIFSIKVFKQQLLEQKQKYLDEINESNYYLKPLNYIQEKKKIEEQKELLELINNGEEKNKEIIIEFEKIFLKCFIQKIEKETNLSDIIKLMYKFRYFMVLPFNVQKNIKEVEELQDNIGEVEKKLTQIAIEKKVIENVPLKVMEHVFETRIITLEELYYKITEESEKYYVQIFDENITEERFEIQPSEKMKINKKIKIFI